MNFKHKNKSNIYAFITYIICLKLDFSISIEHEHCTYIQIFNYAIYIIYSWKTKKLFKFYTALKKA